MNEREVRRLLRDSPLPGEAEARERSWLVALDAFGEREPVRWPTRRRRPLLVAAVFVAFVAAALSPAGQAVIDSIRDAVGRERVVGARQTLSALPTAGRLLVAGQSGAWVVQQDGSKRRLGDYSQVVWSPRGLFIAAVRRHELFAVDPKGEVRWSLAREPGVAWPRWAPSGYRIAYKAGTTLRVVAGDGTGDNALDDGVRFDVPALAWHPATRRHVLAFADAQGRTHVYETDAKRLLWRTAPLHGARQLQWSADGARLVALGAREVRVYDAEGTLLSSVPHKGGPAAVIVSRRPDHLFALARVTRADWSESEVVLLRAEREPGEPRRVFSGTGVFHELAWSPDGQWLLAAWPSADQWVFVGTGEGRRLEAVSNISEQFGEPGAGFPVVGGWCCPRSP